MDIKRQILLFLSSECFGVVGASTSREKYGNKVLRCYLQHNRKAIPVNPKERIIEGVPCVASISELPDEVRSLSIITPPRVTERIVEDAVARGIGNLWMQPGAESSRAVARAREAGINVIAGGSCLLVALGFQDF